MVKEYKFPCYPGDKVWFLEGYSGKVYYMQSDYVEMVGFTSRSIRIKLRNHKSFGKTYTWGKNVFATEEECRSVFEKVKAV